MSAGPWTPWEKYRLEGLGDVTQVEIADPLADEVRRMAWRLRQDPEVVLQGALAAGIALMAANGDALAKAYAAKRRAGK